MCNIKHIAIAAVWLFSLFSLSSFAQSENTEVALETNNYQTYDQMTGRLLMLELPPLDSLFASARVNNAIMLMQEKEIEIALRTMKTEKHNWWSFLRPFGTYQYGLMASIVEITSGNIPINPNYSQSAQSWWNIGISISLPLNEYLDRPNRISKEKATMELQQYNLEVKFDELKIRIAQSYSACMLSITLSRALNERYIFAKAQYEIMEKDFVEGRVNAHELTNSKAIQVDAYVELQEKLSDLIYYASMLETLTKMKIINN